MSKNIFEFQGKTDRPMEVALLDALEDAINDIAPGKMTHIEVVGCLEMLKVKYTQHMIELN